MTTRPPYPEAGGPAAQYPVGPPPVPPRPPLERRARRGALFAGGLSFALLTIGSGVAVIGIVGLVLAGLATAAVDFVRRRDGLGAPDNEFVRFFEDVDPMAWWPLALIAVLVGALIWAAGLLVGPRVLRRHGVERPWPVTWSGFGIAVVAWWLCSGIFSSVGSVGNVVPGFAGDPGTAAAVGIVLAIGSSVISLAVAVGIGALSWWWMAHLFRPRPALAHPSPGITTPVP